MPADTLLLDGLPVPRAQAQSLVHNRGFRLGDGLFETIRIRSGRLLFLERHRQRLLRGMERLQFAVPPVFKAAEPFREVLQQYVDSQGVAQGGKLRLTLARLGGEGGYRPVSNDCLWLAEANTLLHNEYPTDRTQRLAVFDGWRVVPSVLSGIKTTSALPYVLAAQEAQRRDADDALLLDIPGNPLESGRANLFLVVDGVLVTPPLTSGVLAGVMRAVVLDLASFLDIHIEERLTTFADVQVASELFTTNAISGIFPARYVFPWMDFPGRSFSEKAPVAQRLQQALLSGLKAGQWQ